jgi:hypothetical protein
MILLNILVCLTIRKSKCIFIHENILPTEVHQSNAIYMEETQTVLMLYMPTYNYVVNNCIGPVQKVTLSICKCV